MTKFLFDLDGTITKQETLPLIATHFHVKDAIEELTQATVAGNVPFMESFIQRVSILRNLPVDEIDLLLGKVELHTLIAQFIRNNRVSCCIVTGNLSCWVASLLKRIGCPYYASEAVVLDNRIEKLTSILRKEDVVMQFRQEGHKVVFVGDGNNDVEAMRAADVSIASGLTHPPAPGLLPVADYLALNEAALCKQLNQLF